MCFYKSHSRKYDQDHILKATVSAMSGLWSRQPDLSNGYSDETIEHEPNLSFHFANEIWKHFQELNCDFDLTKRNLENKRPDIVLHRRGRHEFNILVIEIKRIGNRDVRSGRCESDEDKIFNYWFSKPLCYEYGLSLIIDEQNRECNFSLIANNPEADVIIRRFHLDQKGNFSEI